MPRPPPVPGWCPSSFSGLALAVPPLAPAPAWSLLGPLQCPLHPAPGHWSSLTPPHVPAPCSAESASSWLQGLRWAPSHTVLETQLTALPTSQVPDPGTAPGGGATRWTPEPDSTLLLSGPTGAPAPRWALSVGPAVVTPSGHDALTSPVCCVCRKQTC